MAQKLIVLEANEIPVRVFRRFQELFPQSNIARLLEKSLVVETRAGDVPKSDLYPSQSWASFNSGTSYSNHKIHWYNDPKPAEYPFYWQTLAAKGMSIGIVGSLHTSPALPYLDDEAYRFLIPDCFAPDASTKPELYQAFQSLNLRAVAENSRAATLVPPMGELVRAAATLPRLGITWNTLQTCLGTVTGILSHKVNREQIRNLQFLVLADVFVKLFDRHKPDVSILFTNHVAASMHRYWYALFPEDYTQTLYDNNWIARYRDEINTAMKLLDIYVGKLMSRAEETERVLVVNSSMGQGANHRLTPEKSANQVAFRLNKVQRLADRLTTSPHRYKIGQAMAPQYHLEFESVAEAEAFNEDVREVRPSVSGLNLQCDVNGSMITLSVFPHSAGNGIGIRGETYSPEDLGFQRFHVDDHHSGCHYPDGSLIVFNSPSARANSDSVDYLEFVPAVLSHFGVPRAGYMLPPTFAF